MVAPEEKPLTMKLIEVSSIFQRCARCQLEQLILAIFNLDGSLILSRL